MRRPFSSVDIECMALFFGPSVVLENAFESPTPRVKPAQIGVIQPHLTVALWGGVTSGDTFLRR
jgi:hypothetical protein